MTKDDKTKIAKAFESYAAFATQCSNVLYNLAQQGDSKNVKDTYGQLVRNHDAARNSLRRILETHGLMTR